MKEFGWTIEYTFSLTYPVFIELFGLIKRARLENAVDSFFVPYAAAKYGKDCANALFKGSGSLFLDDKPEEEKKCTKKQINRAMRKLDEIILSREKALATAAGKT